MICLILTSLLSLSAPLANAQDTTLSGGVIRESKIQSHYKGILGLTYIDSTLLNTMPAIAGEKDILKIAQLTPGFNEGKEGDTGITIRGGNYDQTAIRLDCAIMYNPSHLKGFVSTFNPDIISHAMLYKGELPPVYGERVSGVVDIKTRDGNYKKFHGGLTAGILSAHAFFEGPIVKDKLSFMLAARKSYFNLILLPQFRKHVDDKSFLDQFEGIEYYDANAKLSWKIGPDDIIRLSMYHGRDNLPLVNNQFHGTAIKLVNSITEEVDFKNDVSTKQNWGNTVVTFDFSHVFSNNGKLSLSVFYSLYDCFYKSKILSDYRIDIYTPSGIKTKSEERIDENVDRNNRIGNISIQSLYKKDTDKYSLCAGIDYSAQKILSGIKQDYHSKLKEYIPVVRDTTELIIFSDSYKGTLHSFAAYIDDNFRITPSLSFGLGFRGQLYKIGSVSFFEPEPRIRVMASVGKFHFSAGFNRTSQAVHQINSANIILPNDRWLPVSKSFRPTTANQYYISTKYSNGLFNISVDGYYKSMLNLFDYKDGANLNNISDWEKGICTGSGRAFGIEFHAQARFEKTEVSLAYTWSKSLRKFDELNSGAEFYAANDRRHNVKITLSHKFSKQFDVSAIFAAHTGDRFTLAHYSGLANISFIQNPDIDITSVIHSSYVHTSGSQIFVPVYLHRNNYKLKTYHRMDISATYHIFHKKAESIINLSIYNVYNRKNPYTIRYVIDENGKNKLNNVCILPIIPSLSYTLKF